MSRRRPPACPTKNPTSPRPRPAPLVSHGQDGIPRHTPALLVKLSRICPLNSGNPAQVQGSPCWFWWSGAGSNCRPSAFQELCHPESSYLEKAPAAQLRRIGAADRLFWVLLTRVTSVPECAVSSVGFLWGSPAVSRSCGVSVGLAEAPGSARPADPVTQRPEANDRFQVT